MGGVDRMEQNIKNCRMGVRSKKWWWPVFAFTVDVNLHNAYDLYRKADNNSVLNYLAFTRHIVQFCLRKYGTPVALPGCPAAKKPIEKEFCQESALTAQIIFCYHPKRSPGVPCARKIPGKCARSAEPTYTNVALKYSTVLIACPIHPCGARCIGHAIRTWSALCSEAPHSQFGKKARPHLCMDEWNRPTPVRRRLSLTQAARGKLIPTGLAPVLGTKARSLEAFSQYSVSHL